MPKRKLVFAAALSALLSSSCGRPEAAPADNRAADAEANRIGNASPHDLEQPNASDDPSVDSDRPPDAVSHPDGYLPNAVDVPEPGSKEPPPATEDEHLRNGQTGRQRRLTGSGG